MEISDLFYIVIFLSIIGSIACILLLFIQKVMRLSLPFFIYLTIPFFYALPLTIPEAALLYHEPMRLETFKKAALVWMIGLGISAAFMIARVFAAQKQISKYADCTIERILAVYDECLQKVNLRHTPPLRLGKTEEPAYVISSWQSYVVLQEEIIRDLNDEELKTVLTHELLHIKRKHILLQWIFDFVCCIHWFNPIVWIGRHEFSLACEIDCDRSVLKLFDGELQAIAYAKVMVRLMEYATDKRKSLRGTLGVLDFLAAKQRILNLTNQPSKLQKAIAILACVILICSTIWLSIDFSRSHFHPYYGLRSGIEWSETE